MPTRRAYVPSRRSTTVVPDDRRAEADAARWQHDDGTGSRTNGRSDRTSTGSGPPRPRGTDASSRRRSPCAGRRAFAPREDRLDNRPRVGESSTFRSRCVGQTSIGVPRIPSRRPDDPGSTGTEGRTGRHTSSTSQSRRCHLSSERPSRHPPSRRGTTVDGDLASDRAVQSRLARRRGIGRHHGVVPAVDPTESQGRRPVPRRRGTHRSRCDRAGAVFECVAYGRAPIRRAGSGVAAPTSCACRTD